MSRSRRPAERPSNPDKLLWPEAGFTKQDYWDYVSRVGDRMLLHLSERPLTFVRHPAGVGKQGFFQKDLPEHAPAWIHRFEHWSEDSKRTIRYPVARDLDDLRWMANMAAVELHPGWARIDRPDRPDRFAIDIDPGDDPDLLIPATRWLKEVLDALGLDSMVKTSGKRGLHVYVPIERRYDFSEVRAFGLALARACAASHRRELTVEMRKARRKGRLLLDWSRNGTSQTVVGAYSPRTNPLGTVSTPLDWDEVTVGLDPTAFTLATVPDRGDPWADPPGPQRIETARSALADMGFEAVDRSPRSSAPIE
ncbi:non-homologous end-joining DNA ligase [soil metagenome]